MLIYIKKYNISYFLHFFNRKVKIYHFFILQNFIKNKLKSMFYHIFIVIMLIYIKK